MLFQIDNLTFGYEDETLIENASFLISEGDKIGLIGGNGEGKTTLLRLLLFELSTKTGTIQKKNGIRIGYLPQTAFFESEKTVYEEMEAVFSEEANALLSLRNLEEKMATTDTNSDEYKILTQKYENLNKYVLAKDAYHFDVRIKTVLNGMGFQNAYNQKVSTMSGGEKTRLTLCKLLLEEPELLILDEPTNHLDVKTMFWLEDYLGSFKGALLTVSHDRYFLDRCVKTIFELENKTLSVFKGNYTKYKTLKREKVERIQKEYDKQQETIAHLQDYVDRNLVRASTAKSALSRVKQLEKIDRIEKPKLPPTPPSFRFTYDERPYENTLEVENLTLFGGEKKLFERANFSLKRGEKCAVIGENGTGKSTFIKTLIENKNPSVKWGRFVRLAYYDQETAFLNGENTVLDELWARHPLLSQTEIRNTLARMKLFENDVFKQVKVLSGGEKAKLKLAVFECEHGNVLVLDEPTNHLDLPARESLELALKEFDGTVLFVSHDRYFINAIAGKIAEIENGTFTLYNVGYDEFTALKNREKPKAETPTPTEKKEKSDACYKSKEDRQREAKLKERIRQIENKISALEGEEAAIGAELSTPEVASDFALLQEKCNRLDSVKKELDALYEEYETLI